jgi:dihydroorotate dehydrogenase (NAD+) catalytic subunit
MIKIKNVKISDIVVSSVLGFDGQGVFPLTLKPSYRKLIKFLDETNTIKIGKSFTYEKHEGNFDLFNPFTWNTIKYFEDRKSVVNNFGLTNPGLKNRTIKKQDNLIVSYYPKSNVDVKSLLFHIPDYNFKVLELNLSCPARHNDITHSLDKLINRVKEIRRVCKHIVLIVKIGYSYSYEFPMELQNIGVDIIHSINSVSTEIAREYHDYPGGLSGKDAFRYSFKYNVELRKRIKVPIIMGGGVHSDESYKRLVDIGANAVSVCSIVHFDPDFFYRNIR